MHKQLLFLLLFPFLYNSGHAEQQFYFLKNEGQWSKEILFKGLSKPTEVFIMQKGIGFCLSGEEGHLQEYAKLVWTMEFASSNQSTKIIPFDGKKSVFSYITGNDPSEWIIHPQQYAGVKYENVYDQTDLVMYHENAYLKYDYILKPGSNISKIKNVFRGIEGLQINEKGELEIKNKWETQLQRAPVSYQVINGIKQDVAVHYKLINDTSFGFEVKENYDPAHDLVIDPLFDMVWSSYTNTLGFSNNLNYCFGSAMDRDGNVYMTGKVDSYFPVTPGSYSGPGTIAPEIFVSKFSKDGTTMIYSTYLPGNSSEFGADIAVDDSGRAYVTGVVDLNITGIQTYPTTANAYQQVHDAASDAFLTVLSADGSSLVYSSFLGGDNGEGAYSIALGNYGEAYLVGATSGFGNFPQVNSGITPSGDLQAFVAKFNINQSGTASLVYSVRFGGGSFSQTTGRNIAVNSAGNVFITGTYQSSFGTPAFPLTSGAYNTTYSTGMDGIIAYAVKLSSTVPVTIEYATYLGPGTGSGIDLDVTGNDAIIAGGTRTKTFPVTPGALQTVLNNDTTLVYSDAFLLRLNATGTSLVYSTFLGGNLSEAASGVAVNNVDEAYIAGIGGANFPTSPGSFQPQHGGGSYDFFIAHVNSTGTGYACGGATYVGGSDVDYTGSFEDYPVPRVSLLDHGGNFDTILVAATTHSQDFPTTPGVYGPVKLNSIADQPVFFKLSCFTTVAAPVAAISANATAGCGNVSVDFTDSSTNVPQSWQWNFPGAVTTTSTQQHPQDIIYTANGTYTVSLVACNPSGCDSATYQLIITVPTSTVAVTLGADVIICNNDSAVITAPPGFANYSWQLNGNLLPVSGNTYTATSDGMIILTVTDSVGCTGADTLTITAVTATVNVQGDSIICAGDTSLLVAGTFASYNWTYNGNPLTTSPTASATAQGTYTVTVTDALGCTATDSYTQIVHALPIINAGNDTSMCETDSLQLSASGAVNYEWSPPDFLNNNLIANPVTSPLADIVYVVAGTDGNGCTNYDTISITTGDTPDADFDFTLEASCEGFRLSVQNNSTNATSYHWNFGDGTTSTELEPVHVYQQLENITLQLVAFDNECSDTAIVSAVSMVEILFDSIPNIITPNGDHNNDCFAIKDAEQFSECFSLTVFNRWGSRVYKTIHKYECWNGQSQEGKDLPEGTYYYLLTIGKTEYKGWVLLNR